MEKEALEKAIAEAEVWTLGEYVFDTEGKYIFDTDKQCFWGTFEIVLCLYEVEKEKYRSCNFYYRDGYEFVLSDEKSEALMFNGDKKSVIQQSIAKFNADENFVFLGYPIVYNNIEVEFLSDEDRLSYEKLREKTI